MSDDVDSILARYGESYESAGPSGDPNSLGYAMRGPAPPLATPDILSRMPGPLNAALRKALDYLPQNKELPPSRFPFDPRAMSMLDIIRHGARSTGNWALDRNPEIGPDTAAPLGAGAILSAVRPGRVPHRHFDLTAERGHGTQTYGPVAMEYMPTDNGMYLAGIRTEPERGGRGWARSAMNQFLEETDAAGKPVGLTSRDDPRLWRFYESLGFENPRGRIFDRPAMPPKGETILYAGPRASLPGTVVDTQRPEDRILRRYDD